MVQVQLKDGQFFEVAAPYHSKILAESLGRSIGRAALAAEVNGVLQDLEIPLVQGDKVNLITAKDEQGLELIRHGTAHLLAWAVSELYPSAQITIGPVIEHGFFYDILFEESISEKDLPRIEAKMKALLKTKAKVSRQMMPREEAKVFFKDRGQTFKAQIIEDLPADVLEVSLYQQGEFIDLCRGPHVPDISSLGAFKLMRLAGAYWRGDSNNPMLQRIYGVAFATEAELQAHLHMLEEAAKRDHRILGEQMDLFHLQPEAPGMPFWHPKGSDLFQTIQDYMRARLKEGGYQEIRTPMMMDMSLWENSGHRDKFGDNMFQTETDARTYAIKPMNCPGAIQVYRHGGVKSYADLPLRVAEFGLVHRYEPIGTLHGLMRVRAFTQDDAHVFCTPEEVESELIECVRLIQTTYQDFGFDTIKIKLSTRPEKRIGDDALWDQTEKALADVLDRLGLAYTLYPGEGAFYGPKYEFVLEDALGRDWQCGTIQLDFSMPQALGALYVDKDGERKTPVMIHRAIIGSLERFMAILIENYAGYLPLWLAPVQAVVLPLSERFHEDAKAFYHSLQAAGIRAEIDLSSEKLGYKIRKATLAKKPYQLVIGEKEQVDQTVAVRSYDGQQEVMSRSDFIQSFQAKIHSPALARAKF